MTAPAAGSGAHRPAWLGRAEGLHTRTLALVYAVAATAGFARSAPTLELQLAILAVGVALLGLPHGAIDPWLAFSAGAAERSPAARLRYAARYLALALLVLLSWWLSATTTLLAFLGVSAWHFGRTERPEPFRRSWRFLFELAIRGTTPILAPFAFHPREAEALVGLLLGRELSGALGALAPVSIFVAWTVGAIVWTGILARRAFRSTRSEDAFELVRWLGLLALAIALPVLLAFGLFFCLDHSIRHGLRVAADFDPRRPRRAFWLYARRSLPLTLLTILLGGAAWIVTSLPLDAAGGIRIVFVGLAALTLPHVSLGMPDPGAGRAAGERTDVASDLETGEVHSRERAPLQAFP